MKRSGYSLLAFLGVLIGLALIGPLFINVNSYKSEIIAKTKEATGRDLIIEGPIEFSLLPSPTLTLQHVTLANHPQAHKPYLVMFEKASVKAAILPLFQKRIHLKEITLKKAKIALEKLPNGAMNWAFSTSENSPSENLSSSETTQKKDSAFSFDMIVDKIDIEDAFISYQDGPTETLLENLVLEATLKSLKGPYTAEGHVGFQGLPFKFKLKAGALAKNQSFNAEVSIADNPVKVLGDYAHETQTFKGTLESQLDASTLQHLFPKPPQSIKKTIDLTAQIVANPSQIALKTIKINHGETMAQGDAIATLGNSPQISGKLQNLPGKSDINFTLIQNPKTPQGTLKITVQRLQDLIKWLEIEEPGIPPHLIGKCLFSTRYSFAKETLHLQDLLLTLQEAQLRGEVAYKLNQKIPSLQVDLTTPKVENFISAALSQERKPLGTGRLRGSIQGDAKNLTFNLQTTLGVLTLALKGQSQTRDKTSSFVLDFDGQTPHLGPLLVNLGYVSKSTYRHASLKGHVSGDLDNLNLNTQATLEGLSLTTKGTIQKITTLPSFNLQLQMAHPDLRAFLNHENHPSVSTSGPFSLTSQLVGNSAAFALNHIHASIGNSFDLKGNFDLKRQGEKTKILGELAAISLNLDLLLALSENKYPTYAEPQFLLVTSKPQPILHTWSRDPLDFTFLKNLEADLKITANTIRRKDILITNLKLTPKIQNGILDVLLTATIYGGKLQGNLRVSADNTLSLGLDLQEADLARLVPHYKGQIKLVGGKFSFNTTLSTHGKREYDLIANLTGPMKMVARDGVINGFDLQALSRRLKEINNIQGFLSLLSTVMTQGQTTFKSFGGDILFKNGIGTIHSMTLIADGGTGQAFGSINLPSYQMNVSSEFKLTDQPKLPPFKMYLTGPLDNPQRTLETQALQNYLIQNVFKGVIDQLVKGPKNVGDVLGAILGQEGGAQGDQQKSATKPEKAVKDLLKNLF